MGTMTHGFRRATCRLMVGVVVWAQLAVSAYACPGISDLSVAAADVAVSVSAVALPDSDPTDGMNPSLCAAHCHPEQQRADHVPAPAVPVAALVSLYVLPALPEQGDPLRRPAEAPRAVALAPPAPHAILHCCFRL